MLEGFTPLDPSSKSTRMVYPAGLEIPQRGMLFLTGFTLIELMIVIAIIALITAIALPSFQRTREDSEDRAMEAEMSSIYKAIVEYAAVNEGRLPASYRELRPFIEVPDFESKYEINPDPFQN